MEYLLGNHKNNKDIDKLKSLLTLDKVAKCVAPESKETIITLDTVLQNMKNGESMEIKLDNEKTSEITKLHGQIKEFNNMEKKEIAKSFKLEEFTFLTTERVRIYTTSEEIKLIIPPFQFKVNEMIRKGFSPYGNLETQNPNPTHQQQLKEFATLLGQLPEIPELKEEIQLFGLCLASILFRSFQKRNICAFLVCPKTRNIKEISFKTSGVYGHAEANLMDI